MKSSSAWLTSSAWVQMTACGPPAMTVERAFFSNAGSLLPVASQGRTRSWSPWLTRTGMLILARSPPEVFQAGGDAAEGGVSRRGDGHVEAVLPRLVADPVPA